jgi:hypothetical protein
MQTLLLRCRHVNLGNRTLPVLTNKNTHVVDLSPYRIALSALNFEAKAHPNLIYVHKVEIVGIFICSLIAQERINRFTPNLAYVFLETRKRTQQSQNSGKLFMSSIHGEGISCSSESKHDRRTAARPKLFVSARRLQ